MDQSKRDSTRKASPPPDGAIIVVRVSLIRFGFNSRRATDSDADGLLALIEREGIRSLPEVRPVLERSEPGASPEQRWTGEFECVSGKRRLTRWARLGREAVEVRVRHLTDVDAKFYNFTENSGRKDVAAWEQAEALTEIQDGHGLSCEAIAERVGKDPGYVRSLLGACRGLHPAIWGQLREWGDSCRIGWHGLARIAAMPREDQLLEWARAVDGESRQFKRGPNRKRGKSRLYRARAEVDAIPRSVEFRAGALWALEFALGIREWQFVKDEHANDTVKRVRRGVSAKTDIA